MDTLKSRENEAKLNKGIYLVERHVDVQRKRHEKLFAAELKSRFVLLGLHLSFLVESLEKLLKVTPLFR